MTIRTRRPRGTCISLRRVRRSHKARIAALATVNGISFEQQFINMIWEVLR